MNGPAQDSERIIREARSSLEHQRAGGRRRPGSIGRASASLKRAHWGRKLRNMALGLVALMVGMAVLGSVLDGIGLFGLLAAIGLGAGVIWLTGRYPRLKMPERADLLTPDARTLVGRTEMWLERQRPALPPPAVKLVDTIGLQLDDLGLQLAHVDPGHPATAEVRKLVGEHLPDVIDNYRKIPQHLRYEDHAGSNPNKQFMEALGTISTEIDSVTRQLASGAIDNLAIKTRYLDYRYGEGAEQAD